MIQAQAQANISQQEASAKFEEMKQQTVANTATSIESAKAEFDTQKMQMEAQLKKQLMDHEFEINMALKQLEVDGYKARENQKEDRKDERTKIQASQQSEMIDQRKKDKPPKNFESAGNDILGGGFDLGAFEPR